MEPPSASSTTSEVLLSAPGVVLLAGSLAVGLVGLSILLGVRAVLQGLGEGRATTRAVSEFDSRTRTPPARLPLLPPSVLLSSVLVFYPLSGIFYATSVGTHSRALYAISVVFDGLGRGGVWLSLHLLLPFVAPYPPTGFEWWSRRATDGLLLLLFTGSTITLLASPYVPSLYDAGLLVSHGLALALNAVVLLVVNFSSPPSGIPRMLVLGQLAAMAADIQGMISASRGKGDGLDIGRAGCVVSWVGLSASWFVSSIITTHLLDLAPLSSNPNRRSHPSPYGYGQVISVSSMSRFNTGRPSSLELSPSSFESPELATPNLSHVHGFRPFKLPTPDYGGEDHVGIAVSTSPFGEGPRYGRDSSRAGTRESLTSTGPRAASSEDHGLGLRRIVTSKPNANLQGLFNRSTVSVDVLGDRPPSSRAVIREGGASTPLTSLFRRCPSPSPSVALTLPSPDEENNGFDPFSRQQDLGAKRIQRHNSGYESPSVTTPRPSPRDMNFPADVNYERRPSQGSLALPDLSFKVRPPSEVQTRSIVPSFSEVKLAAYRFGGATPPAQEAAFEDALTGNPNNSRWSTSTSDQTVTKNEDWVKRDSFVRLSIAESSMDPSSSLTRKPSIETRTPTSGLCVTVNDEAEEEIADVASESQRSSTRSPFSRLGSLIAAKDSTFSSTSAATNHVLSPLDLGRALSQINEESASTTSHSPSPKSEKKRPSRLDLSLSPSSIFGRNASNPSPGESIPPFSALDDLLPASPSSALFLSPTTQSRQHLLVRTSPKPLSTSLISRPTPQSGRYPVGHILSNESNKSSVDSLFSPSRRTFGGGVGEMGSSPGPSTMDDEDSPGPGTPRGAMELVASPPSRPTRAREGTISSSSALEVPERESRVSLSTVGSVYDGVPMVAKGGRKGSVPNLSWV